MTRPGSSASRDGSQGSTEPSPRPDRRLPAALAAGAAGAAAFLALLLLGLLLYQRLYGNSAVAFAVIAVLFGAAGLYAGWLAAMMVFSAVGGERRP